jgi:hypothetical protein
MRRALWSVPCATVAWYVLGFGPWFFGSQDAMAPWSEREVLPLSGAGIDTVVIGGVIAGVVAGLVVRRLRIAVPLTVALGTGLWFLARGHLVYVADPPSYTEQRGVLITLLVATGLGAILGVLGTHRSVLAAVALALPVASYALMPGRKLDGQVWVTEVNGLLVATGFAILLYVACWRSGWPAVSSWPVVAGVYLVAFAVMTTAEAVADRYAAGAQTTDTVAGTATDTFVHAFRPFLATYWSWLVAAVFLAIMIVALKIRAVPPVKPAIPYDARSNDAFIPDDLDWIDRSEPRRRLVARREPVG